MLNEEMIEPEADGKYVIKTPSFNSFYLPSIQEVSSLLGLPDSFRKMIPLMESHSGFKLKVGRSSRAKMHTGGFAKPTFKKLISWLNHLSMQLTNTFSYLLRRKVIKAIRAGSNAGIWFSYLKTMNSQTHEHKFVVLLSFIEERANADYLMLSTYKKQVKKGEVDKDNPVECWIHQLPTWSHTGLIPNEVLSDYSAFNQLLASAKITTEQQIYKYLPALVAMRFDFYLAAIANYEIGLSLYLQRNGTEIEWGSFEGFMCSVITSFAIQEKPCHCFESMLTHFKFVLSEQGEEINWQKLASYIEINESGTAEITLKDKQRHQLNDWRRNENLPSDKKFKAFVGAAVKPLGNYPIENILIYARISKGLDTLVAQTHEQFPIQDVSPAIADALARYPLYFEYYKKEALLKRDTTA